MRDLRALLVPWRIGTDDYVVQLDPYYGKARRAWQVPDAVAALVRRGVADPDDAGVWSAIEHLFGDQLRRDPCDEERVAGRDTRSLYGADDQCRVLSLAAIRATQPWLIYLEINQVCNLHCDFCYVEELPNTRGDDVTLQKAADRAVEVGALQVTVTGGEPSLYHGLVELVRDLSRRGPAVTIRTNLLRLPRDVEALAREPRVVVHTSYHHADEAEFDRIVGRKGAKRQITENIAYLRSIGVRVIANVVLRQSNVAGLETMREELAGLDVPMTLGATVFPFAGKRGSAAAEPQLLGIDADDARALLSTGTLSRSRGHCTAAQSKLWLACDGGVYPCELFREEPIGSYVEHSLRELLDAPDTADWRRTVVAESEPEGCHTCGLRSKCPRCPAMIVMEHGTAAERHTRTCNTTTTIHGAELVESKGGVR